MWRKYYQTNRNKTFVLTFLLIQTCSFLFTLFYFNRTTLNSELSIIAKENCTLEFTTPVGNVFKKTVKAGDTLLVEKRPLMHISAENKKITTQMRLENLDSIAFNDQTVTVFCHNRNRISYVEILKFFVALNYHVFWVLVSFVPLLLLLIFNLKSIRGFAYRTKVKFLKHIIRHKHAELKNGNLNSQIKVSHRQFKVLLIIFCFFLISLFVGLGHSEIGVRESGKWRALVALEMKYSKNYITPTINGEYYYNKPPLFNYLLLPIVDSESNVEFKLRSVSVISTILLGFFTFLIAQLWFDKRDAFFVAFIFITSLVIYFTFSAKLLIDPFFALIIAVMFFVNFWFAKSGRYINMFILGYFMASLGFLTKGLPAIYFQCVSLFAVFVIFKRCKKIYSPEHLLGILVFFVPLGFYLLIYSLHNDAELLLKQLYAEVTYKLNSNVGQRLSDIVSFAGKSVISYSPILVFVPVLFFKEMRYNLFKDKFSIYTIIISCLGFLPFWIGNYYPQYILMFIPFLTIVLYKTLMIWSELELKRRITVLVVDFILMLGVIYAFGIEWILYSFLSLLIVGISIIWNRDIKQIFIAYLVVIVIAKLGITLFSLIQEPYNMDSVKEQSKRVISHVGCEKLYLYPKRVEVNHASMFYLSYYYSDIIKVKDDFKDSSAFYLSYCEHIPENAVIIDSVCQSISYKHPDPYAEFSVEKWLFLFKF